MVTKYNKLFILAYKKKLFFGIKNSKIIKFIKIFKLIFLINLENLNKVTSCSWMKKLNMKMKQITFNFKILTLIS